MVNNLFSIFSGLYNFVVSIPSLFLNYPIISNIFILACTFVLYMLWFGEEYQYVITWILLIWTLLTGFLTLYRIYNLEKIKTKFSDIATPFGLTTENRIFPMALFFSLVVIVLSKIATMIMNIISMHQIQNIMPNSRASSEFTNEQYDTFTMYKTVYIILTGMMLFSFMMLYFGISNKNANTYVSMSENVIRNLLFFALPITVIGILLYCLFDNSIHLLESSSQTSMSKRRKLLNSDLELQKQKEKAAQEAARKAAEEEANKMKKQQENDAINWAAEQAKAAEKAKQENDAKCGKCY